jgi:hypothetical protein
MITLLSGELSPPGAGNAGHALLPAIERHRAGVPDPDR